VSERNKAGQEGPTPDFIPGWFVPREGNPDPATREAVRIPDPGDYFPITFLRSNERVSPCQRPRLGFTIGTTSQPGHDRFDLSVPPGYWIVRDADGKLYNWRDEDFKAKYVRLERKWTAPVERDVPSGEPAAAERTLEEAARVFDQAAADAVEARAPRTPELGEESHAGPVGVRGPTAVVTEPKVAREIGKSARGVDAEAWKGTPPAEGTRRKLILDTIERTALSYVPARSTAIHFADAIEEALLKVVDQGATPESGSPASVAMDVLDRMEIDRTRGGKILTIAERVTELADELVASRRECDRLEIGASVERLDVSAEESNSRGGRELHVVLRKDDDDHSNLLFVEIDNEKGTSVGGFERREVDGLVHIVIPVPYPVGPVGVKCKRGGTHAWPRNPHRDGRSCLKCGIFPEEAALAFRDDAWVSEVAYQVAGAATRPLLEDHGDYVFPAERVREAVAGLLSDFGIPRACADCAEEQIGHGAKEAGDRRDATIKQLEAEVGRLGAEVERLLTGREEARAGEDHWKAQRDAAFRLLQWVLPDLMGHPSDTLGADLADDAPDEAREDAPGAFDNFDLSDQARAALSARIEEGRIDPDDLIEIARLG
jgi:hypothetical protein